MSAVFVLLYGGEHFVTEHCEASSDGSGAPRWRVSGKGHTVAGV